jgi:RimJ/RimL family protein N-acetyltransferase
MQVMSIRGEFRCVVLDAKISSELEIYFQGRQLHYEDARNKEVEHNRLQVLNAHKTEGAEYYNLNFEDPFQAHFILYHIDKIVGSAEVYHTNEVAVFESGHVCSDYWGEHLADLLYEARESYVRTRTQCTKASLSTKPDNIASQNAALRNGFSYAGTNNENFIYEKTLG